MERFEPASKNHYPTLDRKQLSRDELALWQGKYNFYKTRLHFNDEEAAQEADRIIEIDRATEADPNLRID